MASTHQPLLDTPHKTNSKPKILFFSISIFAVLLISAVFLLPHLTKTTTHDYLYMCHGASNPEVCHDFVSELATDGAMPRDSAALLQKFLINQARHMEKLILRANELKNQMNQTHEQAGHLADCLELIDLSVDLVFDSIKALSRQTSASHADARAWLSGLLTNHVTCFDGLDSNGRKSIGPILEDLISRARASLAMLTAVSEPFSEEIFEYLRGNLPSWITPSDKKLLETRADAVKADVVVAKDGSGKYKTVSEAVAAVPNNNKNRYVIYVKKGTYKENVEVPSNKKNLMIIGDGMDSTFITANRSFGGGSTTFKSATLAAVAEGFILQDIGIKNTAGPQNHQAVALRLGADKSVVNRCRLDAFQDTLYAHSLRQFYRDNYITGTVDFIFGDAAVVFQRCKLAARKPMQAQQNMVTAQGRTDKNSATGTSIQDCDIIPSSDLEPVKDKFKTFLGRPWKAYSRTVVMESRIQDHIDPAGWSKWDGDLYLNTLYYGEYKNTGPGADTSKRVKWPGFHLLNKAEAEKFTVRQLIQGDQWIPGTGVSFNPDL